jgi:pimeloyl-ACP methyl ester carboxylesterase
MKKHSRTTRSCPALFLLTFSSAFAAQDALDFVTLEARQAKTEDGIRFLQNPERLGFGELRRKAVWRLEDMRPGRYDLDLTYSSGNGRQGQRCGSIRVVIGKAQFEVPIMATGGWGKARIVSIEEIAIENETTDLSVCVIQRAESVHTVLDLWYADLTPWKPRMKEAGKVQEKHTRNGHYLEYIPRTLKEPVRILVVVHGTLGRNETALEVAENFLINFIPAAKRRGVILLAPAFDQQNFGGLAGPGGGYRGLFGREIQADEFLNRILARYMTTFSNYDGTIYLYGHSAGGQFVSRYVVMHPEKLNAAVISAAGSYAFPNPKAPWPDGMQPLRRTMTWDGDVTPQSVDLRPDPDGWLEASQLPVTVLVGDGDETQLRQSPTQTGTDMVTRARCWVEEMNALAEAHEKTGKVRLVAVPGVGHNSAQLSPEGIRFLFLEQAGLAVP